MTVTLFLGLKICFCTTKSNATSGELSCQATGLIILAGNEDMHKILEEFELQLD